MHKKKDPEFGKRLKWLRDNYVYPVSQEEVAGTIGVSRITYQRYEYGFMPNKSNLKEIIDFFNCDKIWLLTGQGDPFEKAEVQHMAQVKETAPGYEPHGGWKARLEGEDYQILGQVYDILKHDTIYRQALVSNIRAFHAAQLAGEELQQTRDKLAALADENKDLKTRLEIIERKVVELDTRNAGQDRIRQGDPPEQKDDIIKQRAM